MKDFLKKLWQFCGRHKYVLAIAIFLAVVLVFDSFNVFVRMRNRATLHVLQNQVEEYRLRCDSLQRELDALEEDGDGLERIAREKFGMHADGEEIFIVNR